MPLGLLSVPNQRRPRWRHELGAVCVPVRTTSWLVVCECSIQIICSFVSSSSLEGKVMHQSSTNPREVEVDVTLPRQCHPHATPTTR